MEALDAHQRGLSDAPLLHKWTESRADLSDGEGDLSMPFVISTDEVDRHGDVIQAQGWQLDAYRNNPVFWTVGTLMDETPMDTSNPLS